MENSSLDDFLDGGGAEPGSEPTDTEAAEAASAETAEAATAESEVTETVRVDPGEVEPASTTFAAGRAECAGCGETIGERWRGEAGLVCPACKEW